MFGVLFDLYIEKDSVICWFLIDGSAENLTDNLTDLTNKRRLIRARTTLYPKFYIADKDYAKIKDKIKVHAQPCLKREISKEFVKVYEITTVPSRYKKLVSEIEKLCGFDVKLYNADLPLINLFMLEKKVFPFAKVEFEVRSEAGGKAGNEELKKIVCLDSNGPDYKVPELKTLKLSIETSESLLKNQDCTLTKILCNDQIFEGSEEEIIKQFTAYYTDFNPDLILSVNGDLFLPFLKHKIDQFSPDFNFGRDKDLIKKATSKSYFSYGRILFKRSGIYFKGRLHIEANSFMWKEGRIEGIIELARTCCIPVQSMNRKSPGTGVNNLQAMEALRRGFIIPYKWNQVESFKTAMKLFESDRGGIIYEPKPGIYDNIAEIDFSSMFPNIMVQNNISPEVMFCECCAAAKVPGLGYNICEKREGIVPTVLRPIIQKRQHYKDNPSPENDLRKTTLKWLLVTSFGYQGFRKARFGRIEGHEAINAFARDKMLTASRIAEEAGFEVIHGIIDSLWIRKPGIKRSDVEALCEKIKQGTGLKIDVEGVYRWIVFLPSTQNNDIPVPTRFYGSFTNGKIKARGIEIRRRDTPRIILKMQSAMLNILKEAKNKEEFFNLVSAVISCLKHFVSKLKSAEVNDLIISRSISKLDYGSNIAQSVIVEKLLNSGVELHPGNSVEYIIKDYDSRFPSERYILPSEFCGEFDKEKYKELLIRSTANILQPFGYDFLRLEKEIGQEKQLTLLELNVEWTIKKDEFVGAQKRISLFYEV